MDFTWAEDYPDVKKMCVKFQLHELLRPNRFSYRPVPSVDQEGPQCGLVALAMCSKFPTKETVRNLFEDAKKADYTCNGEMFSANNLVDLAAKLLDERVELYEGVLCDERITDFLFNGGLMLVPYDSDGNHSPCNKRGHKAHWAVVSGIVETEDCIYVLAKHGKSKNVTFWMLESLSASNSQLSEFSPDRKLLDVCYKIPDGGLSGHLGLKNKAVLIHR